MFSAKDVKELREKTGAGMLDCKKALEATEGNMEKAVDWLREKGIAKAAKKESRIAAEGLCQIKTDGNKAVILEVNSETDFVAKNEEFVNFVNYLADIILANDVETVEDVLAIKDGSETVNEKLVALVAKIGEKISVRRFALYEAPEGLVAAYIHGGGKIGVLVEMKGGNAELGKDIAMQVAAANPSYLERSQVPAAELEHEKEVLSEQARNEGKPEKIIEKMVLGRINKYYKEVCLVDQEFVKDPDQTIAKLLKANNAEVLAFARFQLGEGIEKKQEDFAAEVMSQIKG